MRNQTPKIIVPVILCGLFAGGGLPTVGAARAQDKAQTAPAAATAPIDPTDIRDADALKMGASKFIDAYSEQHKDFSTAGTLNAATTYQTIKARDNAARAKALPPTLQANPAQVRDLLVKLGTAALNYHLIRNGGGTMFTTFGAYALAEREDFLGTYIPALVVRGSRGARSANRLLAQAAVTLRGMARPKPPESATVPSAADYAKQYADALTALARLRAIAAKVPAPAANRLAHQVENELKTGRIDE